MRHPSPDPRLRLLIAIAAIALVLTACAGAATVSPGGTSVTQSSPASAAPPSSPSSRATEPATPEPSPSVSEPPDTGGGTTSGDVPDNAVFLTFRGGSPAFSIQYVEGWQVSPRPDGLVVRDKDGSETVSIVAPQADTPGFVASTDLPALQAQSGFKLGKQDTVKVGAANYVHLVFHLPAPPDPVTGEQVPSTVDRYYVPGPDGLAIVSLSTPDGVDNVDAFRLMIESFRWS